MKLIHPFAGAIAILLIASFWLSTAGSELFGSHDIVVAVKSAIPWGFLLLVPSIAAAGGSGLAQARGRSGRIVNAKLKRMPIIAANGLMVLMPAAFFLAAKARAGEFDAAFYIVQAVELLAGAVNFVLLSLNMRDGFKMTRRFQKKPAKP